MLSGIVEADETYIGGKIKARTKRDAARARLSNKSIVAGAIERGGKLRLRVVPNSEQDTLQGFLHDVVGDDAEAVYTDSHRSYRGVGDDDTIHDWVNHAADEWVRGAVHTNTVESAWSLLDRAILGSYHKLSQKHLQAYCDEFAFRFNNRENPHLFRDTIMRLVDADTLTYGKLTGAAA